MQTLGQKGFLKLEWVLNRSWECQCIIGNPGDKGNAFGGRHIVFVILWKEEMRRVMLDPISNAVHYTLHSLEWVSRNKIHIHLGSARKRTLPGCMHIKVCNLAVTMGK